MEDRLNTVESQLKTDLSAESDITDVFNSVERGFREDLATYFKNEYPVISFEALETSPVDESDHFQNIHLFIEIHYRHAKNETLRQNIKQYISLVQDFLMSDSWRHAQDTQVGRSGFLTIKETTGFRAMADIEATVQVLLGDDTIK